ncbi:hypothetical protein GCM10009821_29070 [Aeromicrobium halocynthiae]|uniref:DUF4064 domain-containing protein n=1 Tax=Aeromicrobium halocynthiae TaxID=560557 RepID=A0ABN2W7C1_9ACTN
MPEAPRRPTPVTLACLFVGFSSLLVIVNLMAALSDWGSLAMQDGLEEVLTTEPVASLDLTMDQLLGYLRIAAQVVIVLAVATGVLALYAARGHEPSRWVLSGLLVLTSLTFVATGVAGLLPALLAAVCVSALWSRDARRWFAEKNGRAVPERAGGRATGTVTPPSTDPFAEAPAAAPVAQVDVPPPGPNQRPRSLELAVWLTVAFSAMTLVAGVLGGIGVFLGADAYRQALEQPGMAQDLVRGSGWTTDAIITTMRVATLSWIGLSLLGLLAALWARTGRRGGVAALFAMCVVTLVAAVVFLPLSLFSAIAAVVAMVQLNKPETRAWVATVAGRDHA